jgi:hypothetical protein
MKYTDDTRLRIQDGIKKYSRIVAQARQRGMNERDTADIVNAMLGDTLGYDPFFDVTAETSLRGPVANYAVLAEGKLAFLLMVKGIGVQPSAIHLLRLSGIAAPPYADWILLTNADIWSVYRLGVGIDRHPELVFRVSLTDNASMEEKTDLFYLLSKEAMGAQALRAYWENVRVLHAGRIASIILSEETLSLLRRELQRATSYRVERHTLYEFLIREVLRPEALSSQADDQVRELRLPRCFAYVRDPNDATTWRLPYRNADGSPNAELLSLAVAALSTDSRIAGVPADDIPFVRKRLRDAYLELGISTAELPEILRT